MNLEIISVNNKTPLMYEDDLPIDITDDEYDKWYEKSRIVDGVRMGPLFP